MSLGLKLKKLFREVRSNGLSISKEKIFEKLRQSNIYLYVECPVECPSDQFRNDAIKESQKKGYIFEIINDKSPKFSVDDLVTFFSNEYFFSQYPLYYTHRQRTTLIENRLRDGELCFVFRFKNEIIFTNWLGFENTYKYNEIGQPAVKTDFSELALSYNIYCSNEHRGNKLQTVSYHYIFKYMIENGYKVMIAFVGSHNTASIKNFSFIGTYKGVLNVKDYFFFKKRQFFEINFPKFN